MRGLVGLVLEVGLLDDVLYVGVDVLLILFGEVAENDWLAIFDSDLGATDERDVLFKYFVGVVDNNRNDRTSGLLRNLKASFVEFSEGSIRLISGAFRIDEDGDTVFYLFDGGKYHFKTLSDVTSVKEETVHIDHPNVKKRYLKDFLLGNKSSGIRNSWIGKNYIENTSVISYIENGLIFRNIFLTDNSSFYTGYKDYDVKCPAYDGK